MRLSAQSWRENERRLESSILERRSAWLIIHILHKKDGTLAIVILLLGFQPAISAGLLWEQICHEKDHRARADCISPLGDHCRYRVWPFPGQRGQRAFAICKSKIESHRLPHFVFTDKRDGQSTCLGPGEGRTPERRRGHGTRHIRLGCDCSKHIIRRLGFRRRADPNLLLLDHGNSVQVWPRTQSSSRGLQMRTKRRNGVRILFDSNVPLELHSPARVLVSCIRCRHVIVTDAASTLMSGSYSSHTLAMSCSF
mmetsp:Transcript_16974/g.38904  ORF Transcript_16974/g.38904 Transcript_16974/m.38904 type:complete len:254 (-) Transcript_16974:226-987(-)